MDAKLREIIESKKDDRGVAEFVGITLTLAEYDFLIEQAELVEELVNKNTKLMSLSLEEHYKAINYKQALERILKNWKTSNGAISGETIAFNSKEMARQALEANE